MNEKENKIASKANLNTYNSSKTEEYINDAPHIKHNSVKSIYEDAVKEVFNKAKLFSRTPKVLDLGAGEGEATLPFLKLGAKVIAVDISKSQLDSLKIKCNDYNEMLEVYCLDINKIFEENKDKYDIVVFNSFLHHLPDYLGIIEKSLNCLSSQGCFFSFQDPIRYDTLNFLTSKFSTIAYLSWRTTKGDIIGGLRRRIRRSRGIYYEDSLHDNAEYHATRNGVDQNAIVDLLSKNKFSCKVITYFSTQSSFFQYFGELVNLKNTFGIMAEKDSSLRSST